MFFTKHKWSEVTDDDKEDNFFIINRFLSKIYPKQAQLLNVKTIDKVAALDCWYAFFLNKANPKEMWSKSETITNGKKEKICFSDKDLVYLQEKFQITGQEMDILIKYHSEELKEELKYLKSQENE
jgi:hypothetical protein